ncbi:hypothetical protein GR223_30910 [Rhizobium leguminosarum]|uniref:hypothetical protein n=1 Tax=Rhizobium ruizarguesonis TaxID=2081791 RepID=UPI0013DFDCA5|nr:hypothetical protein [Rhizobium ruizarguesonis]NEJ90299.1 hypothetical protein [Rhizobium ruizarguesonis]
MADYLSNLWHIVPWLSLTPFIGAIATIIAATLAALVVMSQNAKQARRATVQLRHTEALKLKMRVYEEIVGLCREAGDAEVSYSSYASGFVIDLTLYREMTRAGLSWGLPKARALSLFEKQAHFSKAVIALISLAERWGVIHPGLEMYRLAFNVALHDAEIAFDPYRSLVIRFMPAEIPNSPEQGSLFPWTMPDDATIQTLKVATDALIKAIDSFGGFMYDFQIDMQNLLVGELFEHRIAPRQPLDPKIVVARLDDWEKLKAYFENSTAWGKMKNEIDAQVRKANEVAG